MITAKSHLIKYIHSMSFMKYAGLWTALRIVTTKFKVINKITEDKIISKIENLDALKVIILRQFN